MERSGGKKLKRSIGKLKRAVGKKKEQTEKKWIGVEGNGLACSGASGNEKEWCGGKCRGVE